MPSREAIMRLGILGGGVIGCGWAARAALCGLQVIVYDKDDNIAREIDKALTHARRAYAKLTLAPLGDIAPIEYAKDLKELAQKSDFIQESLPENPELKSHILNELSEYAHDEMIIASSTSGILPSLLQKDMHAPERFIVAHPFNPVYLMPLVELCGGKQTSDTTKSRAEAFYRRLGMQPLLLKQEVSGFIADRLMEALWREALWMVHDDIAEVSDIDDAIRFAPGLRWAFMGPFAGFRLGGGKGGMRHFLDQFAPCLEWDWTHLKAPPWSDKLADKIVTQCDKQADGVSIESQQINRDDCLIAILQALRAQNFAAGDNLKAFEALLFANAHAHKKNMELDFSDALILHRARVLPEWLDYNGHMNESRYLQVFGDASDALYRFCGCDENYHKQGFSYYTAETHIRHLAEVRADEDLHVSTQLISLDDKKLRFFHQLYQSDNGTLLASCEQMALHVNSQTAKACAVDSTIKARLQAILDEHSKLSMPSAVGRAIGMSVK